MSPDDQTHKIDARPTKEFFISMLTRDITTDRAILDLIDNSIDAAHATNNAAARIEIVLNSSTFSILDNAGGLDLTVAKEYAFRFGRSSDSPQTPGSVGQFGVGMKRTLLKIAEEFFVESRKNGICYRVSVNVNNWTKVESWDFYFEYIENSERKEGETYISVTKLRPEASDLFGDTVFNNRLSGEIASAYFKQLHNGLEIVFNDKVVRSRDVYVKVSDDINALNKKFNIENVDVSIICGITDRDWDEGGWYVVCNGRLVAEANKTEVTGWGINGNPKYHADFAFFRGLVEFSCADSSKLPWTTTKTGVDKDNRIYKAALYHMAQNMRPIIGFLRDRAQEVTQHENGEIESNPLMATIDNARKIRLYDAPLNTIFNRPEKLLPPAKNKEIASIQYVKPINRIDIVKRALRVTTNREVGERTFEYFFKHECEDE